MENSGKSPSFKVLVIKPSSLGDILHALPAVEIIKEKHPDAVIDWMVAPQFATLLDLHPSIRRKILFQRKKLGKAASFLPAFLKLVRELRAERYDLVIDMQGLMRSAFFARIAKSKQYWGFAGTREKSAALSYSRKVKVPEDKMHAAEKNIFLACEAMDTAFRIPDWIPPLNEKAAGSLKALFQKEGIEEGKTFVGIVPGARWKSKQWPPEFFASVISRISAEMPSVEFILIGAPDESEAAAAIMKLADRNAVLHDLTGKTSMTELVELIRKCSAVLSNDSGPMHIAAILNVFVFALFGPTDPDKTGPFSKRSEVFLADKSCIKCMKRYCLDGTYGCHSSIDPAMAAEHIIKRLKENGEK